MGLVMHFLGDGQANTFEDMMKRPENGPHFEVIKAMLKAANLGHSEGVK
jgi:hypothetical protein